MWVRCCIAGPPTSDAPAETQTVGVLTCHPVASARRTIAFLGRKTRNHVRIPRSLSLYPLIETTLGRVGREGKHGERSLALSTRLVS